MTRREKILLQICIAIGLIGMSSIYLLRPAVAQKKEAAEMLEEAQFEELQVMTVLETPGIEETLMEQKALAEKNYEYFYGKLNSYTIDSILNQLVADSGMAIQSMSIGDYTEMDVASLKRISEEEITEEEISAEAAVKEATTDEEIPVGTEEKAERFLLGCDVSLTVEGTYRQLLNLVDDLKKESTCIEVYTVNLQVNERSIEQEQTVSATVGLLVYGINDTMLEGKGE